MRPRDPGKPLAILAITTGGLLVAASLARAEEVARVRTRTSTGTKVAWAGGCPLLVLDRREHPLYRHERLLAAFSRSAAGWSGDSGCAGVPRLSLATGEVGEHVGFDGVNLMTWRLAGDCERDDLALSPGCLSPSAAATTTIFVRENPGAADDGEILEADVEINGRFQFADDGAPLALDLQNTLTHEIGHVLGLDHTCRTASGAAPLVDENGREVPPCTPLVALEPYTTAATMFNFEAPGETHKRTPTEAERRTVCEIYATRRLDCVATTGPCDCRAAGARRRPPAAGWWLLTAILALLPLRRHQRRRPRP